MFSPDLGEKKRSDKVNIEYIVSHMFIHLHVLVR